jgi:hypothetical protein
VWLGDGSGKELLTKWHQRTAAATRQETEVPDANETTWQHVQQETTQELIDRQSEEAFPVFMGGVPPAKRNLVIGERDEAVIGNRHPMSVSTEVAKHLFGAAERWFAIDHPARDEELADETAKQSGLGQASEQAVEL